MEQLKQLLESFHNNDAQIETDLYSLFPNAPSLMDVFCISTTMYERQECKEKNIVFIPLLKSEPDNISVDIAFSVESQIKFDIENNRLIRKMLQSIDDEHALMFVEQKNGDYIVQGIVEVKKIIKHYPCYIFSIQSNACFTFAVGSVEIFSFRYGICGSVNEMCMNVDVETIVDEMKCYIPNIKIESFKTIVSSIKNQNTGTSFIVCEQTEFAKTESQRLCSSQVGRGFILSPPLRLEEDNIKQITDIDGGLILDAEGYCYAYGCIFDGTICSEFKGDISRGARYNSVKLYTNTVEEKCVGVVFSDDKMINVVGKKF